MAFLSAISLIDQTGVLASPPRPSVLSQAVGSGKIAFDSMRTGSHEIYVMNADGTNQTQLTDTSYNSTPSLSKDGTKIAFTSTRATLNLGEIYTMNSDGTDVKRLTTNSVNDDSPSWSPDGTKVAYLSNRDNKREVYVMNADGTNQMRVTNNDYDETSVPTWSPDGTQIAYTSFHGNGYYAYVINTDGTNERSLIAEPTMSQFDPTWSPDGTKIAFVSGGGENFDIYTVKLDGAQLKKLTNGASSNGWPTWSPDGTQIAFTSNRDGVLYSIYKMNADGTNQTSISAGTDIYPSWGQGSVASTSDAPVANSQFLNVSEDGAKDIKLTGYDPQGLPLTFVVVSGPANGTLTGTAPNLNYKPISNYAGWDSFRFKVGNGVLWSEEAEVKIFVLMVNDAPTISSIGDQIIYEDSSTDGLPFTIDDDTATPQQLGVTATSDNPTLIPPSGIVLGGNRANRTIKLKPASNQFGTANITIQVKESDDYIGRTTFKVTVNPVNDLPTISNIADQSMLEDGSPLKVNFGVGDVETPAANLVVTATSSNLQLFDANGINVSGTGAARVVTLQPRPNAFGLATITVKVKDASGATTEKSFVVNVQAVNDSPVVIGQTLTATLGEPLAIALTGTDVEGEILTFQLSSGNGLPFTVQQGNKLTFTATNPGTYTINFVAIDQSGAFSYSETITINVLVPTGTKASGTVLSYKPGINTILAEPVPNVVIRLEQKGQTRYTLTTVNGIDYAAYGIAPGEYAARVFPTSGGKFLSFDPLFQTVKVKKGAATVELKPFALYSVFGQVTAIVGTGKNKTVVPVAGATIAASMKVSGSLPITATVTTDANGFYSISGFPKGKVALVVTKSGVTMPNKGKYNVGLPSNAKPNKPIARFDIRGTATSSFQSSANPSVQKS